MQIVAAAEHAMQPKHDLRKCHLAMKHDAVFRCAAG